MSFGRLLSSSFCFATCVCLCASDSVCALWLRPKIHTLRLQNRPSEGPKSSQDRPGTSRSGPERPKSVPSASQERPRASQEPPKSAQERPKSVQERPKSRSRAPRDAPETRRDAILTLRSSKKQLSKTMRRATLSRRAFATIFGRFSRRASKRGHATNL